MTIDMYLREFERSLGNLPGLLAGWEAVPSTLREHYTQELLLLLARQAEAIGQASSEGRLMATSFKLVRLNGELFSLSRAISSKMGFRPEDVVLSGATARFEEPTSVPVGTDDRWAEPLPVAA